MGKSDKPGTIDSAQEFLTRRKMLATSATTFGVGLAGCSSNNNQDNQDNQPNSGGDGNSGGEETITTFMQSIPGEMNFNPWAPSYPWTPSWLLLEPVVRFYADASVSLEMVEDWNYNNDTQELTVDFNDDFYWWNGDQVKAADKYWFEEFARRLDPESSDVVQLTLENNGQTIVREYKESQNPQLLKYRLGGYLGAMMRTHRDTFRPWAEELGDASTSEERTKIQERMVEEDPLSIDTVIDEGLGNGPFKMIGYGDQGINCELFDQHPYADQINIDKLNYELAASEAVAQNIMGGEYDFGFSTLANWLGDTRPDHTETIADYKDTFMRKVEFMMRGPGSKHTRNRTFRRAVAHVLSLEHISANESSQTSPRALQNGLPEKVTQEVLGDYVNDFIEYPTKTDKAGATELLESEGYEKNGDTWLGPDGNKVSLEIVIPQRESNPARTITDQLSQFGFEMNMSSLEGASYNNRVEDSVDFDLGIFSHGSLIAHPFYYYRPTHKAGNELAPDASVVEQALEEGKQRSPYNGKEMIVEIPENVGQEDLSGSTQEVNLYELHQEWLTVQSDERNQEIAETFSWFWNFYVPAIDMYEAINGSWGKTTKWNFNVNDNWEAYRGAYRAAKRGHISPK